MHTRRIRHQFMAGLVALIVLSLLVIPTTAGHSWSNYHWGRTSNSFTLKTGDNVTSKWDPYLNEAIADWNGSAVLQLEGVAGGTNPKNCRPTSGRIEVCNAKYGKTGWLGIAQVWVSGSHITQGVSKLNDTYFDTARYDTPAWRRMVMCQEIAHDFGLGHQDETHNNTNLGSCMDYTNDPDGGPGGASETDPNNEHPDQHDFDQIETIYNDHTDSTTTVSQSTADRARAGEVGNDPSTWGEVVERDGQGRPSLYRKNLGQGRAVFTFVIYADRSAPDRERRQ